MPAVQLMALRGNVGQENSLWMAEECRVYPPFSRTRNLILLLCSAVAPKIPNQKPSVTAFPISFHLSLTQYTLLQCVLSPEAPGAISRSGKL